MKLIFLIGILGTVVALGTAVVVGLYIHKKASASDLKLIGEFALVNSKLDPEGTVIVCGELWRARSRDGSNISAGARVRVVGFADHVALVDVCN
jgi:membrane-bound serine protease (ClpP class)